jgi:hypothetical protein
VSETSQTTTKPFDPRNYEHWEDLPEIERHRYKPVEGGFVRERAIEHPMHYHDLLRAYSENYLHSEKTTAVTQIRNGLFEANQDHDFIDYVVDSLEGRPGSHDGYFVKLAEAMVVEAKAFDSLPYDVPSLEEVDIYKNEIVEIAEQLYMTPNHLVDASSVHWVKIHKRNAEAILQQYEEAGQVDIPADRIYFAGCTDEGVPLEVEYGYGFATHIDGWLQSDGQTSNEYWGIYDELTSRDKYSVTDIQNLVKSLRDYHIAYTQKILDDADGFLEKIKNGEPTSPDGHYRPPFHPMLNFKSFYDQQTHFSGK